MSVRLIVSNVRPGVASAVEQFSRLVLQQQRLGLVPQPSHLSFPVEGYLDGKVYLQHTLAQPVSGRIGLWSKADSHMYFSDYTVTAAN